MMTCSKLYVTMIKYSKSLQVKELKAKVKPVLILLQFFVNNCLKSEFNPPNLSGKNKLIHFSKPFQKKKKKKNWGFRKQYISGVRFLP